MCTRYLSKMLWMLNNCIKHKELNNSIFTFFNKDITVYRSVSPTCQNKISQQFVIRFALDMSLRNLPALRVSPQHLGGTARDYITTKNSDTSIINV